MSGEPWTRDEAYEPYVGRWSRLVAARFLALLPPAPGAAWCDVGCGTGALAHAVLASERPARVLAVDPSQAYLDAAGRAVADPALATLLGTATALPAGDAGFDRVVSGLVLNFVADPNAALAEMRRVARPDAVIAAYVWDYAGGMELIRTFWAAAAALDPAAADLDEGRRFPLCRPEPLRALFESAGLAGVRVEPVDVPTVFTGFDDLWNPFLGGQGPAPGYCAGLSADARDALRDELRQRVPVGPDGTIAMQARAWAVWGREPAAS